MTALTSAAARLPSRPGAVATTPYSLTYRSPLSWLIAGYFFYLPLANLPIFKVIRNGILELPVLGSATERAPAHPLLLLLPDFVFGLALMLLAGLSPRTAVSRPSPARFVLQIVFVLTLAGGVLSAAGSEYPGLAMAGLVTRLGVLLVALVIVRHRPTPEVARLWLYAAILATAMIMTVGIVVYLTTFGMPSSLADLPIRRTLPQWLPYQRVTFGHAANNTGLVLLVFPAAVVMFISTRGGAWWNRTFLLVAMAVFTITLFFSFQRWGFGCFLIAIALITWYWRASWRSLGLLVACTLVGVVIGREVISQLGTYFADALIGSDASSLDRRREIFMAGVEEALRAPTGIGFGTVNTLWLGGLGSAHNMLVDNAIESGILGGLALLTWIGAVLVVFTRLMLHPSHRHDLPFALALGAMAFVLFGVFFNGQMFLAGIIVWYAFLHLFPLVALILIEDEAAERAPAPAPARQSTVPAPTPMRGPAIRRP